jgi:hypothetical protein
MEGMQSWRLAAQDIEDGVIGMLVGRFRNAAPMG